jgi:hypothetical protein
MTGGRGKDIRRAPVVRLIPRGAVLVALAWSLATPMALAAAPMAATELSTEATSSVNNVAGETDSTLAYAAAFITFSFVLGVGVRSITYWREIH